MTKLFGPWKRIHCSSWAIIVFGAMFIESYRNWNLANSDLIKWSKQAIWKYHYPGICEVSELPINSMTPGCVAVIPQVKFKSSLWALFVKLISGEYHRTYKSPLLQVVALCRQYHATRHYLSQCWPRSISPYGVTRSQWVKVLRRLIILSNTNRFVIYGAWLPNSSLFLASFTYLMTSKVGQY